MKKIMVLVVDDHIIIRQGIVGMLVDSSDIKIIGEAKDGEEAVRKASELMPDIILMDLNMPKLDGVSAIEQIVTENPHIKILVLTVSEDGSDLVKAIKAGARGYLLKDTDRDTLISSIKAINRGESVISQSMAADLIGEFKDLSEEVEKQPHPFIARLTDREQEVLKLLADGLDNKGIASKLHVSESTVKNHVSNILSKLQIENRIQAAVIAVKGGLI